MADKVGKVPVERLIVLVTEHIEIYDMSNRLYHNTHHKESIWRQIGLSLECPCKYNKYFQLFRLVIYTAV